MDIKRILMALLKTIRDIMIILGISALITIFVAYIRLIFGVSIASIILYLAIFLCFLITTIAYYKEGGKK